MTYICFGPFMMGRLNICCDVAYTLRFFLYLFYHINIMSFSFVSTYYMHLLNTQIWYDEFKSMIRAKIGHFAKSNWNRLIGINRRVRCEFNWWCTSSSVCFVCRDCVRLYWWRMCTIRQFTCAKIQYIYIYIVVVYVGVNVLYVVLCDFIQ